MEQKEKAEKLIKDFKIKNRLDLDIHDEHIAENIAATIHLMNEYRIDFHAATDQSSRSGGDEGIDGWHYNDKKGELFIYQSKLSQNKGLVLKGLNDLLNAKNWIESVLIKGNIKKIPDNTCLYNLYIVLSQNKEKIKKITFILVSLFNENELEDEGDYDNCKRDLIDSNLNKYMEEKNGKIDLKLIEYNFDSSLPTTTKKYPIKKIEDSRINLEKNSNLNLAYVPLVDLIELYSQRKEMLFDKNIRLSVINTKDIKERLVHPMEDTFNKICSGKLDPNIFPFFHLGVTIAATTASMENETILLESPNIINGCQTITIAYNFYSKLRQEKEEDSEEIKRFKRIKVIAKIVVGITDEQLKQITNSNNRQIPIENWQLFSNDQIHIEIEDELKISGIFYERQKGKFEALMKQTVYAGKYPNTNKSFIKIFDLGQIICLSRKNLQWAAKPSEIFINKKNHDSVFDRSILGHSKDIILVSNLFKAIKRALIKYLEKPSHSNDITLRIFNKPLLRTYIYYLALIDFYQSRDKLSLRKAYSTSLNKIAAPNLVAEFESFLSRVITKTKNWYIEESKEFKIEVSNKKLDQFLNRISLELDVNLNGQAPFTNNAIDWSKY